MNAQQSAAASALANTPPDATVPTPAAVRAQMPCPTCQGLSDVMGPGAPMCANCMMMANAPGSRP